MMVIVKFHGLITEVIVDMLSLIIGGYRMDWFRKDWIKVV